MAAYRDTRVAATVDGFMAVFCATGLMDEARVKVGGLGGFCGEFGWGGSLWWCYVGAGC